VTVILLNRNEAVTRNRPSSQGEIHSRLDLLSAPTTAIVRATRREFSQGSDVILSMHHDV
jgi:hypothetical protein